MSVARRWKLLAMKRIASEFAQTIGLSQWGEPHRSIELGMGACYCCSGPLTFKFPSTIQRARRRFDRTSTKHIGSNRMQAHCLGWLPRHWIVDMASSGAMGAENRFASCCGGNLFIPSRNGSLLPDLVARERRAMFKDRNHNCLNLYLIIHLVNNVFEAL
jgi:hypothetical protein